MEYDGGAQAPAPSRFDGARHVWPGQPGYETAAVVPVPAIVDPPADDAQATDPDRWEDDGGAVAPSA